MFNPSEQIALLEERALLLNNSHFSLAEIATFFTNGDTRTPVYSANLKIIGNAIYEAYVDYLSWPESFSWAYESNGEYLADDSPTTGLVTEHLAHHLRLYNSLSYAKVYGCKDVHNSPNFEALINSEGKYKRPAIHDERINYHYVLRWLRGCLQQSSSPNEVKPVQRAKAQEEAIKAKILQLGHTLRALPKNKAGKSGVKAQVRESLVSDNKNMWQGTAFNKAWQRLRDNGEIGESATL